MSKPSLQPKIFACTNSKVLGTNIAKAFGEDLGNVITSTYSDGEFQPSYEESIRGTRIFIIASTNPGPENLMELLLMLDAAKRASARHITAVIPYFGWARQDRKDKPRVPIAAKLVAKMLETDGFLARQLKVESTLGLQLDSLADMVTMELELLAKPPIILIQAQSKVAHVNTQELVESMPEMQNAKSELEKLAKTYETDIQAMATELQNKIKQYDAESSTKTDEENGKRLQEVQGMEQSIRQYQAQAQQDLQKKELELLKPITEKAKNAILKVGNDQGFDYVLDSSQGQGVIMANGKDLLADIKSELGF